MSVCPSVTLEDCAQLRRGNNVGSHPSPTQRTLTAANPFFPKFCPKVTHPAFCSELDRNVNSSKTAERMEMKLGRQVVLSHCQIVLA